jgi:hypothetical protein
MGAPWWTPERDEILDSAVREHGFKVAAERLSTSVRAVANRASFLGIRSARSRRWTASQCAAMMEENRTQPLSAIAAKYGITASAVQWCIKRAKKHAAMYVD